MNVLKKVAKKVENSKIVKNPLIHHNLLYMWYV